MNICITEGTYSSKIHLKNSCTDMTIYLLNVEKQEQSKHNLIKGNR